MGRTRGSKNKASTKKPTPSKTVNKPKTEKEERIEPRPIDGVVPKQEVPKIPEVLVDGGLIYRFLLELRRNYEHYTVPGEKEEVKLSKKRAIQVIDSIMEYVMRMEKKQHG
jgi:hypothetical protein